MIYSGNCGEHINTSAQQAIALADKHNRKVQLHFNGVKVWVNKRLSVKHVVGTWQCMMDAAHRRYSRSPGAAAYREQRAADIKERQELINQLLKCPPCDKLGAAVWLAAYIPASDLIGVDRRVSCVIDMLVSLGFVANQHVGDKSLLEKSPPREKRIEYIAGQVIDMLSTVGCVHPMLGDWAEEASR